MKIRTVLCFVTGLGLWLASILLPFQPGFVPHSQALPLAASATAWLAFGIGAACAFTCSKGWDWAVGLLLCGSVVTMFIAGGPFDNAESFTLPVFLDMYLGGSLGGLLVGIGIIRACFTWNTVSIE